MLNAIPVVGWLLSLLVNTSLAIPFWLCWTVCGIGQKYFDFLPPQWQSITMLECIGLFISVSIIQTVFVPKIVSVSQSSKNSET